ncbi:MAG: site-specific DNA-methyltransferase [Synechococcus sp. SB0678_bin_12]|nr:site-specific DNA-methyltransferase [Synechococcus sp. SB0678_bin_12]MYI87613.1 site-specific DNA-methyltransferase [Synechococcus sp. SB0672_bin_10]
MKIAIWTDILRVGNTAKALLGYPTQKPLALLDHIIKASSNPGDPFCGCATALVAADRLGRQWAGIDLSPLAIKLVNNRIIEERGLWGGPTALDTPPRCTGLGRLPSSHSSPPPLPTASRRASVQAAAPISPSG